MATSNRIEGIGGGTRGVGGGITGRARANSGAAARAVGPKASRQAAKKAVAEVNKLRARGHSQAEINRMSQAPSKLRSNSDTIAKNSVKVTSSRDKISRAASNAAEENRITSASEGISARRSAREISSLNTGRPKQTVKINSANHQPRIGGHAN